MPPSIKFTLTWRSLTNVIGQLDHIMLWLPKPTEGGREPFSPPS
jgi:hypothetical protein